MTDNEKRAHDLALVTLQLLWENTIEKAGEQGRCAGPIDIYEDYKRVYEMALESFEYDFPSEE